MKKLNTVAMGFVLLSILAPFVFAGNFHPYAVRQAFITDGDLILVLSEDHRVTVDVRGVEVNIDSSYPGTYINMSEDWLKVKKLDSLRIYVRNGDVAKEWNTTLTEYIRHWENPSDIVPTVVR